MNEWPADVVLFPMNSNVGFSMTHSLEVYRDDQLIFVSDGKWLQPLLELHDFLAGQHYDPERLVLKDKIVGKAAALIQVYLGVKNVHASMLSRLARTVFEEFKIRYDYEQLVDRIQCRTEDLLEKESNPQAAFELVRKLAAH